MLLMEKATNSISSKNDYDVFSWNRQIMLKTLFAKYDYQVPSCALPGFIPNAL